MGSPVDGHLHESLTFLVSMMLSPCIPQVLETLDPSDHRKALGGISVSVYVLGFSVGMLFIAPLSDKYGRAIVLRCSSVGFLVFTLVCGFSTTLDTLIGVRFLAGCFAGPSMALGGAVVADVFPMGGRGKAMASYTLCVMLAPTVGPVLGGAINGSLGWRWVFWIASMLIGICVLGLLFMPETHRRVLQEPSTPCSTAAADHQTHNTTDGSIYNAVKLMRSPVKPAGLMFSALSILMALSITLVTNGIFNMILVSIGYIFQTQYRFEPTVAGLPYLASGLGCLTGLACAPVLLRATRRNWDFAAMGTQSKANLVLALYGSPLSVAGLILYGWTFNVHMSWIVPISGLFVFGLSSAIIRLSVQLFLLDITPDQSISIMAAFAIANSIGGSILPLAIFPLYDSIGYGYGNMVLASAAAHIGFVALYLYFRDSRGSPESQA